jgi:transposase
VGVDLARGGTGGGRAHGRGRRSEALEAHAETILGWVRETPDMFLREIVARLIEREVETSQASVARLLARHGVTRKKRRWSPPSGLART